MTAAAAAQKILWQPSEKQSEFLSAPEFEVLYGGAAGGGKSDALLVDCLGLQQGAIRKPHYRAILFRRTFPELRELTDRARELYPSIIPGARYHEADKEWRFPSGAKVLLGYLEADRDRFRYQGAEYQWVGWDELTQWGSSVPYEYLLSRVRTTDPELTCYVRATTNPGGYGHEWVRNRFGIADDGGPTRFLDPDTKTFRRFIPARLADNPHLSSTDYGQRLTGLSAMERRALLDGRWDVIEVRGAIYGAEMETAFTDGRICRIPIEPSVPVNTFWDLGMNDTMAIWFHQQVGPEHRFVDYYETNGEALAHYVRVLRDRGYLYGEHYLPHDVEVRELSSGRSRRETLEALGVSVTVVERVEDVQDGIEAARQALATSWFDRERCARGIECLKSYRREYDSDMQTFKRKPLHDWSSNGADAYRQFAQGYRQKSARRASSRRPANWRTG